MGLHKVSVEEKQFEKYRPFIDASTIAQIEDKASSLRGLRIVHVNATEKGGGVAEMLHSQVALERDLGLDSHWYTVVPQNTEFFDVTKKMHNLLQGADGKLSLREKEIYIAENQNFALSLRDEIERPHILMIHDPQPGASVYLGQTFKKLSDHLIWRCHIDTTEPDKDTLAFILPLLEIYDGLVFSMDQFVPQALRNKKIAIIKPFIDPLSEKNKLMSKEEAQMCIREHGVDPEKPLVTQVSRLDPWKDPFGVIDAFKIAQEKIPDLQLALVAESASDDPEGQVILEKVEKAVAHDPHIFLLVNLEDNERMVNAFQTASTIILQKSLREGFGLTVAEALWKRAVVIAGDVGGVRSQITNGFNGYLVNKTEEMAELIVQIIDGSVDIQSIGTNAHETVKNKFLIPNGILNHLELYSSFITGRKPNFKAQKIFIESNSRK